MSVSKRKTKSRKRKIEDVENDTNIVLSAGTNPTKRRRLNDTEDGNKENKNNIFNGKDPKSYTVKQLKDLCRKQKLKVGGNKTQLIARLLNPPKAEKSAKAKNKSRTGRLSTKRVDNMLKGHGVNNPQSVSNCLKKGIQRGHVIIDSEEGLDGILIEGSCICCSTRHVIIDSEEGLDEILIEGSCICCSTRHVIIDSEGGLDEILIEGSCICCST
eukprot:826829_1